MGYVRSGRCEKFDIAAQKQTLCPEILHVHRFRIPL
jgi:hypothetical protein